MKVTLSDCTPVPATIFSQWRHRLPKRSIEMKCPLNAHSRTPLSLRRSSPSQAVGVIVNCKIVQMKVGGVRNSICQPNPFGFILYPKNTFITLFVTRALASLLKSWCVYNWGPAMYLTQLYYLSLIQTTSSTSVHPPTLSTIFYMSASSWSWLS